MKNFIIHLMKSLFCLILLFLVGCSFQPKEERFVNPLFYKDMDLLSQDVDVRLTPKTIFSTSIVPKKNCKLLKNTKTELEFSCDFDHPLRGKITNEIYRYILEYKSKNRGCYIVREETDGGKSWYCIYFDE